MYRDLILPITDTTGDANALSAAIALAAHQQAHLSVMQPLHPPMPVIGDWGVVQVPTAVEIQQAIRAEGEAKLTRLRSRLDRESIAWELRANESIVVDPVRAMVRHARYADLAIMAAPVQGASDASVARYWFSAMLFESGRPVLVIPAHHPIELPIRHVVLAWKPSRESTRALHDALPLLSGATSIDVVTVDPVVGDNDHGPEPGADIATHLARHGLRVNVVNLPSAGQTVATVLLHHAAESQAGLLVAGGYGHSRLREWALGGTTRELLQAIHLPILFSH